MLWLGIWSGIECGLGIIAGSLATLRPLGRQLSKLFRSMVSGASASDDGGVQKKPHGDDNSPPPPPSWPARAFKKQLPMELRGMSILSDTLTFDSCTQVASVVGPPERVYIYPKGDVTRTTTRLSSSRASDEDEDEDERVAPHRSRNGRRWWRWSPPRFAAGLMTEFDRGLRDARGGCRATEPADFV